MAVRADREPGRRRATPEPSVRQRPGRPQSSPDPDPDADPVAAPPRQTGRRSGHHLETPEPTPPPKPARVRRWSARLLLAGWLLLAVASTVAVAVDWTS